MANTCNNNLMVRGAEEDIVKFLQAICTSETPWSDDTDPYDYRILESLVPTPEGLKNSTAYIGGAPADQAEQVRMNREKYGYESWYDWNYDNWGTKWADDETFLASRDTGYCTFHFQTPWASPESGIDAISKLFPTLEFVLSYMEQGMGFVGATAYKNGKLASTYTEDISVPEVTEDEDYGLAIDEEYFKILEESEELVSQEAGFNRAKV